jgi:hypothetical protein
MAVEDEAACAADLRLVLAVEDIESGTLETLDDRVTHACQNATPVFLIERDVLAALFGASRSELALSFRGVATNSFAGTAVPRWVLSVNLQWRYYYYFPVGTEPPLSPQQQESVCDDAPRSEYDRSAWAAWASAAAAFRAPSRCAFAGSS